MSYRKICHFLDSPAGWTGSPSWREAIVTERVDRGIRKKLLERGMR